MPPEPIVACTLSPVELACCRFLRFRLDLAPDLGPMTLTISGSPGTTDAIGELLGL